jgi:DNA-directed RNA polymerase specialized sigma24 family protein
VLALVRLAKLLVGDQPRAEDIVQDVFLGLYRALPRLRDREAILPYLRASVVNRSRSTLRSRRRATLSTLPPASPGTLATQTPSRAAAPRSTFSRPTPY